MASQSMDHLLLLLFTTDVAFAKQAEAAGVDSVIVDWEWQGKQNRQAGYSTEVNTDIPKDVAALAEHLSIPVTVRIDRFGEHIERDIEVALDHGARIIMLPMAKKAEEVARFVRLVGDRAKTIVQIETESLVKQCDALGDIGWDHAYIGLNDLMITRKASWIWEPLFDQSVDRIFDSLQNRSVGFGGVTVVGGGRPIPFTDLIREMARLGCQLSFMRRTFKREIKNHNMQAEMQAVRTAWAAARLRTDEAIRQDHQVFLHDIVETKRQLNF